MLVDPVGWQPLILAVAGFIAAMTPLLVAYINARLKVIEKQVDGHQAALGRQVTDLQKALAEQSEARVQDVLHVRQGRESDRKGDIT